jgi:hypothetical protein
MPLLLPGLLVPLLFVLLPLRVLFVVSLELSPVVLPPLLRSRVVVPLLLGSLLRRVLSVPVVSLVLPRPIVLPLPELLPLMPLPLVLPPLALLPPILLLPPMPCANAHVEITTVERSAKTCLVLIAVLLVIRK